MAKKTAKSKAPAAVEHCHAIGLTAEDKKRSEEWAIEDDARTLQRAIDIRSDKARLAKVKAWAKKRAGELSGLTSITD